MSELKMKPKTYLGDGVYVRWDEYGNLILTTEDGRSITNEVVLDPDVRREFRRFMEFMREAE